MLLTLQANYWLRKYEAGANQDLALFNNILFPMFTQSKIEFYTFNAYLENGIKTHNRDLIMLYVNWAKDRIKNQARLDQYQSLIAAYQALDDQQGAYLIKNEAKFLFPKEIL